MKTWLLMLVYFCIHNVNLMAFDINLTNKIQTTVKINTSTAKYQDIAKTKALKNLSIDLYSEVSNNILPLDNLKQADNIEKYKTIYKNKSNIKYKIDTVRPIEHNYIKDNQYMLIMYIDFNISDHIYTKLANNSIKKNKIIFIIQKTKI